MGGPGVLLGVTCHLMRQAFRASWTELPEPTPFGSVPPCPAACQPIPSSPKDTWRSLNSWAHGAPSGRKAELWDQNSPITLAGAAPCPHLEASSPEAFRVLNQSGWMRRLGYRCRAGGAWLFAGLRLLEQCLGLHGKVFVLQGLWRENQRKMGNLTLPMLGGGVGSGWDPLCHSMCLDFYPGF